jgi:hypothetical protein
MPVDGDHPVLLAVALDDRHGAGLDEEEVVAFLALTEQHLPRLDLASRAERAKARALLVTQAGKRAVAVDRLLDAEAEYLSHGRCSCARSSAWRRV